MGWERRHFAAAPGRQFTTPWGETGTSPLIEYSTDTYRADAFYHWCDMPNASGWFAEARRLFNRSRDELMRTSATDFSQRKLFNARQNEYVFKIFEAVANAYNCLNVPWYLHQQARMLYNVYLSGPLDRSDTFAPNASSCKDWYLAPGEPFYAVISDQSRGILPRMARALYKTRVPSGVAHNLFVQSVGIGTAIVGLDDRSDLSTLLAGEYTSSSWYYERDVMNAAFLTAGPGPRLPMPRLAIPYLTYPDLPGDGWVVDNDHTALSDSNRLETVPLSVPTDFVDDWRSFRGDFGATVGGDPRMKISLGPYHYLQWLGDWLDLIESQQLDDVIISVREMALYWNQRMIRQSNSAQQIMSAIGDQYGEAARPDQGLLVAGQAAAAIGAALASVTYGISALIGAGVSLGLNVAATVADPARVTAGRDDLGRWKPMLERPWCGGDPSGSAAEYQPKLQPPPSPIAGTLPTGGSRRSIADEAGLNVDAFHRSIGQRAASPTMTDRAARTKPPSSGKLAVNATLFAGGAWAAFKILSALKK